MLEKKIALLIVLFALVVAIPLATADFIPGVANAYAWVDKTQYKPGETVTLYYVVLNDRTADVVLKEVRIETPWFMYINDHWEGNQTIKINEVLEPDDVYRSQTTFTVPNDGRALIEGMSATIEVRVDLEGDSDKFLPVEIGIASQALGVRDMETVTLLMAVQIILIVVCTALIAGAIFLSARKPHEGCAPSPPPPPQTS